MNFFRQNQHCFVKQYFRLDLRQGNNNIFDLHVLDSKWNDDSHTGCSKPITNRICYYAYFTIAFEPLLITYEHNNLPRTDGCIL